MTINTGAGEIEAFAMANCRQMLLTAAAFAGDNAGSGDDVEIGRTFRCKTCDRKFSSFQALGGHRASHKKIKPPSLFSGEVSDDVSPSLVKPKVHTCPICGKEFPIGQALGGHMRRHRSVGNSPFSGSTVTVENSNSNSNSDFGDNINSNNKSCQSEEKKRSRNGEMKKGNGVEIPVSRKKMCTELDLELRLCSWNYDDVTAGDGDVGKIVEEGEIVGQDHEQVIETKERVEEGEEESELLKLELRPPINNFISYI